jgi:hypothetical protein
MRDTQRLGVQGLGRDRVMPETLQRGGAAQRQLDFALEDGARYGLLERQGRADLVRIINALDRLLRIDALLEREIARERGSRGGGENDDERPGESEAAIHECSVLRNRAKAARGAAFRDPIAEIYAWTVRCFSRVSSEIFSAAGKCATPCN